MNRDINEIIIEDKKIIKDFIDVIKNCQNQCEEVLSQLSPFVAAHLETIRNVEEMKSCLYNYKNILEDADVEELLCNLASESSKTTAQLEMTERIMNIWDSIGFIEKNFGNQEQIKKTTHKLKQLLEEEQELLNDEG